MSSYNPLDPFSTGRFNAAYNPILTNLPYPPTEHLLPPMCVWGGGSHRVSSHWGKTPLPEEVCLDLCHHHFAGTSLKGEMERERGNYPVQFATTRIELLPYSASHPLHFHPNSPIPALFQTPPHISWRCTVCGVVKPCHTRWHIHMFLRHHKS